MSYYFRHNSESAFDGLYTWWTYYSMRAVKWHIWCWSHDNDNMTNMSRLQSYHTHSYYLKCTFITVVKKSLSKIFIIEKKKILIHKAKICNWALLAVFLCFCQGKCCVVNKVMICWKYVCPPTDLLTDFEN